MKQVLHSLKDGSSQLADVPSPRAVSGQLPIHTSATLVSAGTERMLVAFGRLPYSSWRCRMPTDRYLLVFHFSDRGRKG